LNLVSNTNTHVARTADVRAHEEANGVPLEGCAA
jgi:hypothetical protein